MRKALMISSLWPPTFHSSSIFPVRCWGSTQLFAQHEVLYEFRPLCTAVGSAVGVPDELEHPSRSSKRSMLLERLRIRHLKGSIKDLEVDPNYSKQRTATDNFEALGLLDEVTGVLKQMGVSLPTEIQKIGIPAVLGGKNVVMGSHTGSGKTLAYLLPIVQMMRRDEASSGMLMKPRRPRAVVLCPTRELCQQVFGVAKMIGHHARFRAGLLSGGFHMKGQEESLKSPVDMVVGTPGRLLQHIEERNIVYGDIRYLVLDEADTMFDHGFGADIRRFLKPLKNRASKTGDPGYQAILVTATMTKGVRKLIDEEFESVAHLVTSSFQKRVSTARHDFIDVPPSEDKLSVLLQVLEPSLRRGDRAMVFCNTLDSSRAVDHFLADRGLSSVNYHGDVPPQERVENLVRFRSDGDGGDCPTLVCTDLAARGLDMAVDHVIMFDFPLTSTDYVHRTGRTARMGAKGRVTSLVCKRDLLLATRIRDAVHRDLALDGFNRDTVRRDAARARTGTKALASSRRGKREPTGRSKPVRGASATSKPGTGTLAPTSSLHDKRKPPGRSKPFRRAAAVRAGTGTTTGRSSRDGKRRRVVGRSRDFPVLTRGRHSNSFSKKRKSPPKAVHADE